MEDPSPDLDVRIRESLDLEIHPTVPDYLLEPLLPEDFQELPPGQQREERVRARKEGMREQWDQFAEGLREENPLEGYQALSALRKRLHERFEQAMDKERKQIFELGVHRLALARCEEQAEFRGSDSSLTEFLPDGWPPGGSDEPDVNNGILRPHEYSMSGAERLESWLEARWVVQNGSFTLRRFHLILSEEELEEAGLDPEFWDGPEQVSLNGAETWGQAIEWLEEGRDNVRERLRKQRRLLETIGFRGTVLEAVLREWEVTGGVREYSQLNVIGPEDVTLTPKQHKYCTALIEAYDRVCEKPSGPPTMMKDLWDELDVEEDAMTVRQGIRRALDVNGEQLSTRNGDWERGDPVSYATLVQEIVDLHNQGQ